MIAEIDFLIQFAKGNKGASKCKQFGHNECFVCSKLIAFV